ncbi:MAG: DUF190 domain-containing protein [Bryobacteraceae bacterium]|jgi:PII-like signaling protein
MPEFQPATLLRLHICERDLYNGRALHECILEKCRELRMTRISAVRALEGYGGHSGIHRSRPVHRNLPVVITIIDTPDRIGRLLPVVEKMMDTGTIATSPVEMLVVSRRREPGEW